MTRRRRAALVAAAGLATACGARYGYNFLDPAEPRFAPSHQRTTDRRFDGKIRVVSFNIKFGRQDRVGKAIEYLRTDPLFRDPDVLLLQEMNCDAVEDIAAKLGGNWVYYPAAWHPQGTQWAERPTDSRCPPAQPAVPGGYFGVGIVTPWTLRDDQKILLPQLSQSDDAQKVAVAATVDFGGAYRLRAVNVHLQSGLSPIHVGDQVQVITRCVFEERCPDGTRPVPVDSWALPGGPHGAPGNVVLAGDFNTSGEAHIQVLTALLAPQAEKVPLPAPTFWLLGALGGGRLDHVFHGEGLQAGAPHVGTSKVSDHRPVVVEMKVVGERP